MYIISLQNVHFQFRKNAYCIKCRISHYYSVYTSYILRYRHTKKRSRELYEVLHPGKNVTQKENANIDKLHTKS